MMPKTCTAIALGLAVLTGATGLAPGLAGRAHAQAAPDLVASHSDWSVFVAGEPKGCFIISPPSGSKASRDGQPVEVDRGDIRLSVDFRPAEKVAGEVSFSSGYPIRNGEPVKLQVGSETFAMDPGSGDSSGWAWPESPEADATLVAAMRRGSTATVTGVSARGTTTVDSFSLAGFTAAVEDAEARCQ